MAKIFCIGLNKTGTNSLDTALQSLGFRSLHWGGFDCAELVNRALREALPPLHYIKEDYDAYSDIEPLTLNFDLADQHYPGSKFIMTLRDLDSWLDSRTRHVQKNLEKQRLGTYGGKWTTIDREAWTELWHAHNNRVSDYFKLRTNDFLVMNICAGQGYETLCPFLNKPLLETSFPWRNRNRG